MGGEIHVGDVSVEQAGYLRRVAAACVSPRSRLQGDVGVVRAGFLERVAAARVSPRSRLQGDVGVVRAGFLERVAAARISPRSRLHTLHGCVTALCVIGVLPDVMKEGSESSLNLKLEAFFKLSCGVSVDLLWEEC